MRGDRGLRHAARALAVEAGDRIADHPAPDDLLAYQRRTLSTAAEDRVQEHLAVCAACALVVLDLDAFPDVRPAVRHRLTARGIEKAWEELRDKAGIADTTPPRRGSRMGALLAALSSRGFAYILAGCLLLTVLGLTVRVVRLQQAAQSAAGPSVHVAVRDLVPDGEDRTRGPDGRPQVVRVPERSERILLLLNLDDFRSFPDYLLTIEDAEGRPIWSRTSLARSGDGNFTLELRRGFLEPGVYRLRLAGLTAAGPAAAPEPLVEYTVELSYE